ncbi:2-hydroxyacid dehydrogenase [Cellulomonas sp. SLBN-39]|uniref:2-hydroxyacid dehydrogenase n=1 Tax=Cellulomonas sp. SLBN-39 TaxID=2768446 RepID=UPI001150AD37|nr:2-hydroxyacid dehydrogenase [Cellulomonas sp. SLBN-39]TQL02748.1 phosphoglycerate dehydrogenase-like enzyme [Cellulomonas sp. SLBN-39]
MLTWTFPTAELRDMLGEPPAGVRVGLWDQLVDDEPADVPLDEVDAVLAPDWVVPEPFERIARAPRVRFVQLSTAGYEHVRGVLPAHVTVANGRGVHSDETAELAVGLVLAQLRGIDVFARRMAVQYWEPGLVKRPSLAGKRVLVVGAGSIGTEIRSRLLAFRTTVTLVGRTSRDTPDGHVHGVDELPSLLPHADVVVVVIPLTDLSEGLVDAAFLGAMPDGALLVNVARGRVVDTAALLAELGSGRLRAALDVTDPEPLPPEHPLWRAPNLLITPHVGGDTPLTEVRVTELVRRQLTALVAGTPLENVVAGPVQPGA